MFLFSNGSAFGGAASIHMPKGSGFTPQLINAWQTPPNSLAELLYTGQLYAARLALREKVIWC
jgi:hypothetical protein